MLNLQDIQAICGIVTTLCTVAWIVNQWMFYTVISKQIKRYQERVELQNLNDRSIPQGRIGSSSPIDG